jgi:hypothetical protein
MIYYTAADTHLQRVYATTEDIVFTAGWEPIGAKTPVLVLENLNFTQTLHTGSAGSYKTQYDGPYFKVLMPDGRIGVMSKYSVERL